MAEDKSVSVALYRLALLESTPLRRPADLLEWNRLRRWVLSDPDLLRQYREQNYFSCAEEITKIETPPKKIFPYFSRFFAFIKKSLTYRILLLI